MRLILIALALAAIATAPAAAHDSRTYGSKVARSKGTVSRAHSVGGHPRSSSARCASCAMPTAGSSGTGLLGENSSTSTPVRRAARRRARAPVTWLITSFR
jgi:hypothetical protein